MSEFFSTNEGAFVFYNYVLSEDKGSVYKVMCLVNKFTYSFLRSMIPKPYDEYGNAYVELIEREVCDYKSLLKNEAVLQLRFIPFWYARKLVETLGYGDGDLIKLIFTRRSDISAEFITKYKEINGYNTLSVYNSTDVTIDFVVENKDLHFRRDSIFQNGTIVTPSNVDEAFEKILNKKFTSTLTYSILQNKSFTLKQALEFFEKHKGITTYDLTNFKIRTDEDWEFIKLHPQYGSYYKFCRGDNPSTVLNVYNSILEGKISPQTLCNNNIFNENTLSHNGLLEKISKTHFVFHYINLSKGCVLEKSLLFRHHKDTIARNIPFSSLLEYIKFVEQLDPKYFEEKSNSYTKVCKIYIQAGKLRIKDIKTCCEYGISQQDMLVYMQQ